MSASLGASAPAAAGPEPHTCHLGRPGTLVWAVACVARCTCSSRWHAHAGPANTEWRAVQGAHCTYCYGVAGRMTGAFCSAPSADDAALTAILDQFEWKVPHSTNRCAAAVSANVVLFCTYILSKMCLTAPTCGLRACKAAWHRTVHSAIRRAPCNHPALPPFLPTLQAAGDGGVGHGGAADWLPGHRAALGQH